MKMLSKIFVPALFQIVLVLLKIWFILPENQILAESIAIQLHALRHWHLCGRREGFKYLFCLFYETVNI
jgi:hypothetical protein